MKWFVIISENGEIIINKAKIRRKYNLLRRETAQNTWTSQSIKETNVNVTLQKTIGSLCCTNDVHTYIYLSGFEEVSDKK